MIYVVCKPVIMLSWATSNSALSEFDFCVFAKDIQTNSVIRALRTDQPTNYGTEVFWLTHWLFKAISSSFIISILIYYLLISLYIILNN